MLWQRKARPCTTCPRVLLIGGGSVAAVGETDEILSNKELLEQNRLEVPIGLMK